jgi:DNA-binding YbaB/EbfC family protein
MLKEFSQLAGLLKQVQELPGQAQEVRRRLAEIRCRGESAGGLVTVEVSGHGEAVGCEIDPSLLAAPHGQRLELLVVEAFNAAQQQARQRAAEVLGPLTGGLNPVELLQRLGNLTPSAP